MKIIICVFLAFFAIPIPVLAQKTSLSGFVNYQNLDGRNDLGWTRVFPRLELGRFQLDFELEFQDLDDPGPMEWINQARLIYRLNKKTSIMFGRNFRAFGYSTFAPVLLKTAKYPKGYPFASYYAYGVRVDRNLGLGKLGEWTTKMDLTATPVGDFRQIDFLRPEASFSANQSRHGNLSYGFAGQFSREFARGGVHAEASTRFLVLSGGIFSNNDLLKHWSGLVLVESRPWKSITPHIQFYSSPKKDENWTFGIATIRKMRRAELKAIIDHDGRGMGFRAQINIY